MPTNLITLSDKIITFDDDEFIINQTTRGLQTDLVVKALTTNAFACIWSDWGGGDAPRLMGRILDPNDPNTSEFVIESDYRESGSNHSISVYNHGFSVSYSTAAEPSTSITKFFDNTGDTIEEFIGKSQNEFTLVELQEIYESPELTIFDPSSETNIIYESTNTNIILDQSNYRLVDKNQFYFNISTEGVSDSSVNLNIVESIRDWDNNLDDWVYTPTIIDEIKIDQFSKSDIILLAETDSYFDYILEYRPDYPLKWDANALSSQNTILITWSTAPQDGDREGLVGRFATINSRPEISQILFKEGDEGYLREDYSGINFDGMPPFENFLYDTNRLFADISLIEDSDGTPTNIEEYTFEWFVLPNAEPALVSRGDTDYRWGEPLIGENKQFFDIRDEDIGKYIHARVTYTDLKGTFETIYSVSHKVREQSDPILSNLVSVGNKIAGSTISLDWQVENEEQYASFSSSTVSWYADGNKIQTEGSNDLYLYNDLVGQSITATIAFESENGNQYYETTNSVTVLEVLNTNDQIVSQTENANFLQISGEGNQFIFSSENDVIDTTNAALNNTYDLGDGDDTLFLHSKANLVKLNDGEDRVALKASEIWSDEYVVKNVAYTNEEIATGQTVVIAGKNRFSDVIEGGAGIDTVVLTDGDDVFVLQDSYSEFHSSQNLQLDEAGRLGAQRIIEIENIICGAGDDVIDLTSTDYLISDTGIKIEGDEGDDTIWGTPLNDEILGGDGNDTIFGGSGNDFLTGGLGEDTFEFTATAGEDTITDFNIIDDSLVFYATSGDSREVSSAAGSTIVWDDVTITLGMSEFYTEQTLLENINVEFVLI